MPTSLPTAVPPAHRLSFLPLLVAAPAWAAGEPPAPGLAPGSFLQAMLALVLIVALLLAFAWLARKLAGGKGFGQGGMKVIGGVALGPRERIVMVEAGDTWLVIGIVPGQIRTLHTLPKGSPPADPATAGPGDRPFAHWLKQMRERRGDA